MFSSGVGGGGIGGSGSRSGGSSGLPGGGIGSTAGGFATGISCSGPVSWLCQEALRCTSKVAPNVSGVMAECDQCAAKFTLLKRKRTCGMCTLIFCSNCVTRLPSGSRQCHKCQVLSQWPVDAAQVAALRVKDLRNFLHSNNINTVNCREKRELIDLVTVLLHNQHRRNNPSSTHQHHRGSSSSQFRPSPTVINTTVRDDGIRVRPTSLHAEDPHNSGSIRVRSGPPASPGSSAYDPETDPGIRVFGSESNTASQVLGPSNEGGMGGGSPATESEGGKSCGHCHSNGDCSASCSSLDDSWAVVHNPEREGPMHTDGSISSSESSTGSADPPTNSNSSSSSPLSPISPQLPLYPPRPGSTGTPSSDVSPQEDNVSTLPDPSINLPNSPILSEPTSTGPSSPIPSAYADSLEARAGSNSQPILEDILPTSIPNHDQGTSSCPEDSMMNQDSAAMFEEHSSDIQDNAATSSEPLRTNQESASSSPEPSRTLGTGAAITLSDIKQDSDLHLLSVKQIKHLLALHRVNYSGVCEKQELLNRLRLLLNDYNVSKKDMEGMPEELVCKICMDAPIDCVLLECGHMVACIMCGKQMSECPVCRQFVVRVVRTFRA